MVLELDHVSGEKSSAITNMVRGGAYRWDTIAAEIEKCVVRCANCHRRRTAVQLGYRAWRDLREPVVGIEPTTPSLRVRCSTPELHRQFTPVDALRKHFGLGEDGTFRNQSAIRNFLAPGELRRNLNAELQWPVSNEGARLDAPPLGMPWRGFEPRRLSALPPQDSVSTSFTTRACGGAR